MAETPRRTYALLLTAGMIWGTSFVAGKLGVEDTDPYLFTAMRATFSALSIIPILLAFKLDLSLLKDKWLWLIGLLNAMGMFLQNVGLTYTTASKTVLLVDINVVIVAVLAVLFLKEELNRRIVAGLVLGMAGVGLIATGGDLSNLGGGSFIGDLLVFLAGVAWAFYIVLSTKVLKKGYGLVHMTCTMILITWIFAMPFGLAMTSDFTIGASSVVLALYTGVFCTTVAFLLYNVGLKSLGATTTSIILLVEMVFGLLFSFLLLGERPDTMTVVGGSLVLAAIMVISVKGLERARRRRSGA
ncbi:MAG: DMT family transporter [Methanomassiliicoccales archaeon]|nr:DMT family transporter [Methanomassiliicoccales archaeon]